ncbi:MAG: glutamate racemase [Alicyclobacillaceae bacterium]|nr:glutamate racemase [Alicyclobacillaceae bacterium]
MHQSTSEERDIVRSDQPIGVFDSGIGGLTVAAAIAEALPNERIFYFGDTARCPYGDRSVDEVVSFSRQVLDFLYALGVKMLVVACNTATAAALPALRSRYPVPVLGVVEPGARAAVAASSRGRIGVIGTAVTIRSGAYEQSIKNIMPDAQVWSLACPSLVPLVERGEWSGQAVEEEVRRALAPLRWVDLDTLILGCTHYPLLQGVIQRAMGNGVRLISSAEETSREVGRVLASLCLLRRATEPPVHRLFTSGDPERMAVAAQRWLSVHHALEGARVELVADWAAAPTL